MSTATFPTLFEACQYYVSEHRRTCCLPTSECIYVLIPPNLASGILHHRIKIMCVERTETWKTIAEQFTPVDIAYAKQYISLSSLPTHIDCAPAPVAAPAPGKAHYEAVSLSSLLTFPSPFLEASVAQVLTNAAAALKKCGWPGGCLKAPAKSIASRSDICYWARIDPMCRTHCMAQCNA